MDETVYVDVAPETSYLKNLKILMEIFNMIPNKNEDTKFNITIGEMLYEELKMCKRIQKEWDHADWNKELLREEKDNVRRIK